MTSAWLGRFGGGGFRSSDSLRGSLTFSVIGFLQTWNMRLANLKSTINLLFLLIYLANLALES